MVAILAEMVETGLQLALFDKLFNIGKRIEILSLVERLIIRMEFSFALLYLREGRILQPLLHYLIGQVRKIRICQF